MLEAMARKPGETITKLAPASWPTLQGATSGRAVAWNEARTQCLLLSGEEFSNHGNPADPAAVLQRIGTEQNPFASLNGWFHGLFVDLPQKAITLFNDRYGMGRVYYHESPEGIYFASEAKALLAALPVTRELKQESLAEYVSVGCVLQNRTLFRDIHILPPGSAWTFRSDGTIDKRRYFDGSAWEQQEPLSPKLYSEQLRDVFSRVLPRYFRGPEPIGLSLTGGLDSRMILAWAGATPGTLPCYTFGGPYRDCADVTIAHKLAQVTQQAHTVLPILSDFFRDFGELAEETIQVSDGTMDVSGAVELYMNRKAVAIAPIRLTGNYGSEILRSNVAFRPRKLDRTLYTPEFNRLIDGAEETYRSEATGHRLSFIAFKQVPWHHYSRYSVEKALLTPRSPFLDNDLVGLAYRAPVHPEGSAAPLLRLIADGSPTLGRIGSDRSLRHGPPSILNHLVTQWQEFTAKAEYAYDYGMPHWLARSDRIVSSLHFERLFLGRHKFYHFRIWYKHALKKYMQESVSVTSIGLNCYRKAIPEKLIYDHLTGKANHTLDLHRIASLALIGNLFRVSK